MEFLSNLLDTVKGVAPTLAGSLVVGATGNPVIGGAVASIVKGILGKPDDGSSVLEAEAQEIIRNPEMYLKLRTALQEMEIKKLQEETKHIGLVNQTMQIESRSESKIQRSWRPFNGFAFGITLFCDYFLAQTMLAILKSELVWVHVPSEVYILWSSVLGITVGSRGIEKVSKLSPVAGVMGIVKSGFGK